MEREVGEVREEENDTRTERERGRKVRGRENERNAEWEGEREG